MQIVQALKKVPIREQKLLENVYSQEQLMTLHNKAVGRRVYKHLAKAKPLPNKTRNGLHSPQRSRPFLTNHGFSTPTLCPRRKLKPTAVSSTCNIIDSKWVGYEPVQSRTNPIEFVIKPLADYIDINKTELRLAVKITKQGGSATGERKKYKVHCKAHRAAVQTLHVLLLIHAQPQMLATL